MFLRPRYSRGYYKFLAISFRVCAVVVALVGVGALFQLGNLSMLERIEGVGLCIPGVALCWFGAIACTAMEKDIRDKDAVED